MTQHLSWLSHDVHGENPSQHGTLIHRWPNIRPALYQRSVFAGTTCDCHQLVIPGGCFRDAADPSGRSVWTPLLRLPGLLPACRDGVLHHSTLPPRPVRGHQHARTARRQLAVLADHLLIRCCSRWCMLSFIFTFTSGRLCICIGLILDSTHYCAIASRGDYRIPLNIYSVKFNDLGPPLFSPSWLIQ